MSKFRVGNIVKITNDGELYSTCDTAAKSMNATRWEDCRDIEHGIIGVVLSHYRYDYNSSILYLFANKDGEWVIGESGLELVSLNCVGYDNERYFNKLLSEYDSRQLPYTERYIGIDFGMGDPAPYVSLAKKLREGSYTIKYDESAFNFKPIEGGETMKKCIEDNFPKTKEATLVEREFENTTGGIIVDPFVESLLIRLVKDDILAEAKRREEQEE